MCSNRYMTNFGVAFHLNTNDTNFQHYNKFIKIKIIWSNYESEQYG